MSLTHSTRRGFLLSVGCFSASLSALPQGADLDVSVGELSLHSATYSTALAELAIKSRPSVLFGVEVPDEYLSVTTQVSISAGNTTPRAALDAVCSRNSQLDYRFDHRTGVVSIRQKTPSLIYDGILGLTVNPRLFKGREWPENLFRIYAESSPELIAYQTAKRAEYRSRRHAVASFGQAGAGMKTSVLPPEFSIRLTGETVRDQLNEIAAYTRSMQDVPSPNTPNGFITVYPTGWQFRVVASDRAQNGLGGFLEWSNFPR